MKKLCNDEFSFSDLKSLVKSESRGNRNNLFIIIFAVIGAVASICAIVYAVKKSCGKCKDYDFDDFGYEEDDREYDENGCVFTDEDDFEE